MRNFRFKTQLSIGSWVAVFVLSVALAGPALGAAPYYEGKTIEVIIPFPVAGGTDIWIRTIAPYLEKHIPGSPKFTFRNIGGGRGIPGMMEFALKAKSDGLHDLGELGDELFPRTLGRQGGEV